MPRGASRVTVWEGSHFSSATYSRESSNSDKVSTLSRPGAASNDIPAVRRVTGVLSARSNCHSLTKIVHPCAEEGVWRDSGGLRT